MTWTPARDTGIPNPGASLEAIRLRDGNWIMVYNDLEKGRYSLVAALSDDEGATWKWKRHLDGRPTVQINSQYHYPSVIQAKDGAIHVTYSYFTPEGKSVGCWGGPGREPGRLCSPWALVVDSRGRVHVIDSENDRVQRIRF